MAHTSPVAMQSLQGACATHHSWRASLLTTHLQISNDVWTGGGQTTFSAYSPQGVPPNLVGHS